jgi:hypothetical protein
MRALVLLLLVSGTALADDAGLLRCRAIKDPAARLSCYDALVVPASGARATPMAPAQATPGGQPAAAASAPPPAPQTPQQFGLEYKSLPAVLDSIESTIPGRFEGWGPNANIKLANGQVWQVTDDSSGVHWIENPKVRIRRGALSAFYMEIEGTNRSPKVRRLQ